MLSDLDRKKDLALLCINDDVTQDHAEITSYFRGWQEKRWGEPAAWEADVGHYYKRAYDDGDGDDEDFDQWGGRAFDELDPNEVYHPDPPY